MTSQTSKKPSVAQKDDEKQAKTQKILKKLEHESEEQKAADLAQKNNLPYVDLNLLPVSSEDVHSIPEEDAKLHGLGIIQKSGKKVRLALLEPADPKVLAYIEEKLEKEHGFKITPYVVSRSSMERIWKKYQETPFLENLDMLHMTLTGEDLRNFEAEFGDLIELKKRIREIPTTQIINTIMAGSVKMRASDVHFEPQEKDVRLRFRLDGILQDIGNFPSDIYRFILSRLKLMGKMKINVRDTSQDGHFSIALDNGRVDIRVNIIPGKYGESVVMRLLNQTDVMLDVDDLGLRGLAYEAVQKEISKPHGMILTTGPTGSGKTTTLYALVNKLNTPDVKIVTIEDPIEYEVKGVSQTQVAKDRGYSFASGLRAIVRQDPDVILVGEIRDDETAEIAVAAASTGHLVLSTLHSNNAPASIPRLIELGIKPNLIPQAVNAFIAQRLVRKLCPECREKYIPAKETLESIQKILAIVSPKAKVEIPRDIKYLYKPVGCTKCHNTGYKGRVGIFEVLTINETIEKLVLDIAGETELMKAALEEGMITMAQDGILKAVEGITSMEEVWRSTGQEQFLEEIYNKLMEQSLSRSMEISDEFMQKTAKNTGSFQKINEFILKSPSKDLLKAIFANALLLETGDIHIEPAEKEVNVRFRIDGILQTVCTLPLKYYPAFLGEIKLLSGFKSEVRSGVLDGRFAVALEKPLGEIKEPRVDVRVSVILGGFGETVVLRLLNKSAVALDIEKLGIRKGTLEKIIREVKKPNGVFLNTGPTGSGKTTTLYSLVKMLNKPEVKIITVEDPIEYQLEGVLQTQTNDKDGYSFSQALRSLLRQNPDIMMIGEIRDEETAQIAVQASLTGHLVLSTLHTNDAAGSVQRLLNMGVRPDDLASAANGFMAQRLVRKLCDCKEKIVATTEEEKRIEKVLKAIPPSAGATVPNPNFIFKPKGCSKCNGTGYKGRTTLSEILVIGKEIKELIFQGASADQIREKAVELGMITLQQDGILKALEGETTLEEVERVTKE